MKGNENGVLDTEISMTELLMALQGTRNTATGKDQLSYIMFQKLREQVLKLIVQMGRGKSTPKLEECINIVF